MIHYIIRRLLLMVVTMFGIILLTFVITRLAPGDPATIDSSSVERSDSGTLDAAARQIRIIYGLDKPMLLNLRGEQRAWFVREQVRLVAEASDPFDRIFAERELLDLNTAALPEALKLLGELVQRVGDTPYPGEKIARWRQWQVRTTRFGGTGLEGLQQVEMSKAELAAIQLHELLRLLPRMSRTPMPAADVPQGTRAHMLVGWQQWAERQNLPHASEQDAWAERQVAQALAANTPEALTALTQWGGLVAPPLMQRLEARGVAPGQRALLLNLLAEAMRRPGFRVNQRLVADRLADHLFSDNPEQRRLAMQHFTSTPPAWLSEALAEPEPLSRVIRERVKKAATVWEVPALAELFFTSFDPTTRELALVGIRSALDHTRLRRVPNKEVIVGWIGGDHLIQNLLHEKLSIASNWWLRAQYQMLQFGTLSHSWNAVANTQFGIWMGKIVRFDFDVSITHNRPVLDLIRERLPITLFLSFTSIFIAYIIAIPLGIWSAISNESLGDRLVTLLLFVLYSMPSFWVAGILIIFFTVGGSFNWFYASGIGNPDVVWVWGDASAMWAWLVDRVRHLFLPIFCLTYASFAFLSRQMRSALLETVRQDFIRTARAKGLPERKVIFKHALRNSLIPILTLAAGLLPALIGGSVIIEQIFSIRGMGLLGYEAVLRRDYAVINAIAVFSAFLTLVGILLADLSYALTDPRITYD